MDVIRPVDGGHRVPGTGTTSEVWPILIFGSGQGEENCWNLPIKPPLGSALERMVESDMVHHQTPSLASWEPPGQDHGSAGTNNLILDTSRGGNEGRLHVLMARCHHSFFLVAAVACVPMCAVCWPGHCLRRQRWFTMAIMSLDLDKWTSGQMTDISLSIQIQMFWLSPGFCFILGDINIKYLSWSATI